ncbi:MAG: aminotransferase class V-fold PLP-dependent enzyme, partial [Thiovulaceae bacterium]|nr:aminotransferase class V-fold PLP-dependent enzyme [Sulfurimonadaceae bacterium]
QAVAHMSVDVKELDADFYAFSAHKMYGPTGVGALYGKKQLLGKMNPYQGGGAMIENVSFEKSDFLPPPHRFEAGTQPIAEVISFASAVDYLNGIGFERIQKHDQVLIHYAKEALKKIEGMQLFTSPDFTVGSLSFLIEGFNLNDLSILLDKQNIYLRAGHHCAMPIMQKLGLEGTLRVSFGIYNETKDIDTLIQALEKAKELLS